MTIEMYQTYSVVSDEIDTRDLLEGLGHNGKGNAAEILRAATSLELGENCLSMRGGLLFHHNNFIHSLVSLPDQGMVDRLVFERREYRNCLRLATDFDEPSRRLRKLRKG